MFYDVTIDGKSYHLELTRADEGWHCRLVAREVQIDAVLTRPDVLSLLIEGKTYEVKRGHRHAPMRRQRALCGGAAGSAIIAKS